MILKALKSVLAVLGVLYSFNAMAYDVKIDGIYYNVDSHSWNAEVTSGDDKYTNDVVIPESFEYNDETYYVTSIGPSAFDGCNELTSVTIPNGITSIGEMAFCGSGLTSLAIPRSVKSIGDKAFINCSSLTSIVVDKDNPIYESRDNCNAIIEKYINRLIVGCSNTVIPNGVLFIGDVAFYGCRGLTTLDMPKSVIYIGTSSFEGTAWYENQQDGVIYINNIAYKYKGVIPSNTKITIKEGITYINSYAFSDCKGIISVSFPSSLNTIGTKAFSGCSDLTVVTMPNSITSIGESAFDGCTGLTSITISKGLNDIQQGVFANCTKLSVVTIPNNVTTIGDWAFSGCTGLTSVSIGSGVTTIGRGLFFGCSNIKSVHCYADNPPDVGAGFIRNATLYVPKPSVKKYQGKSPWNSFTQIVGIEKQPLKLSYAYDDINHEATVVADANKYSGDIVIPAQVKYQNVTYNVTTIGEMAFAGCDELESVTIPNSVTTICSSAFVGSERLNSLTIPNSITTIGKGAFDGTAWYNNQDDGVIYVNNIAYQYKGTMPSNTNIIIKEGTTCIADYAFQNCSGLTSLEIPRSVTAIGNATFEGCRGIKSVKVNWNRPLAGGSSSIDALVKKNAPLYVPKGTATMFMAATGWSEFADIVEFDDGKDSHYITIRMGDDGTLKQSVELGKTYIYAVSADEGVEVNTITFDGKDMTALLIDGMFSTPVITGDSELNVVFKQIDTNIKTMPSISNVKVYASNKNITVVGADKNAKVDVYGINGAFITSAIGDTTIPLEHGVYIVKVGQESFKVGL